MGRRARCPSHSTSGEQQTKKKKMENETTDPELQGRFQRNLRKRPAKSCDSNHNTVHTFSSTERQQTTVPVQKSHTPSEEYALNQKKDIFTSILESKLKHSGDRKTDTVKCCSMSIKKHSLVNNLFSRATGFSYKNQMRQACTSPIMSIVKSYKIYRRASPFDRRCTVLEWHPTNPSLLAAGSKGGDIILWNCDSVNKDLFIEGRGPGGSVSAMKFHPYTPSKVFTAALDGKVSLQDFHGKQSQILLDTMTWDYWYTSLDIQPKENLMVAGESTGKLTLMSMDGKQSWTKKLHKSKITHAEFNKREPWLLCTASTDKTCKLWDVRMVEDRKSALHTLEHSRPINSAYFSLTDGTRLLTTDQQNEIRVYSSPSWQLERSIQHPHRFFQHITPIKAQWHPLQDIVIIGRYPDDKFPGSSKSEPRSVDFFCSQTGNTLCQLLDSSANGIISLNQFSPLGNRLASAMGVNILVWEQPEYLEQKQEKIMVKMMDIGVNPAAPSAARSRHRGNAPSRQSKGSNSKQQTKSTQMKVAGLKIKHKNV